jgi:transposase
MVATVILNNLRVRKSEKAARILKEYGCWFLFLPPYGPDLNPIEMAVSKLKSHLRRIGARTIDRLIQAIGDVCELYTPDQCLNYFRASGYVS